MDPRKIFLDPTGRLRAIWRALAYIPAYLLLAIALESVAVTLSRSLRFGMSYEQDMLLFAAASALALLAAAGLFLHWLDRRRLATLGLWFYGGWWKELALGLGIGFLMLTAVVGLEFVLGVARFRWEIGLGAALRGLLWSLVLLLSGAIKEELELRGYVFQRLIESVGPWPAAVILSILFGLLHLGNPSRTVLSTINTALIGFFLAISYLKTRALWLPVGVHFGWNFFLGYVYSLPLSGLVLHYRLFHADTGGPSYLTGGGYGPEGSLLTTGVILAATLCLGRTRKISVSDGMTEILK